MMMKKNSHMVMLSFQGASLFAAAADAGGGYAFADKSAIQAALQAWCDNPSAAVATYGAMDTWDVSAVDDFTYLFSPNAYGDNYNSCFSGLNEDIDSWNTGQVTNMGVRRGPNERPRGLCGACAWG
jgi:surface protein